MRWRQPALQPQRMPIVGSLDMRDQIAIASNLVDHREVKPHFIRTPSCLVGIFPPCRQGWL
jgi:hypothetical protein